MVSQLSAGYDPRRLLLASYDQKYARSTGVWKFLWFFKNTVKKAFAYDKRSSMGLFLLATYLAMAKYSSLGASKRTRMLARQTL